GLRRGELRGGREVPGRDRSRADAARHGPARVRVREVQHARVLPPRGRPGSGLQEPGRHGGAERRRRRPAVVGVGRRHAAGLVTTTSRPGTDRGGAGRLAHARGRPVSPDGGAWEIRGLVGRLVGALELACVVVDDFGDGGYEDRERPVLSFGPEKVVAEAAMLAHVAHGLAPGADGAGRGLVDRLAPRARSRRALADMALRPEMVVKRAVPHVLLERLGSHDGAVDDLAAQRCAAALRHAVDQPATVLAERRWLCSLWPRLGAAGPPQLCGSILERPLDLRSESREDAYGLTHMLFYVTDLGRRPPDAALLRDPRSVLADVEGLLARYLDH